MIKLKIWHKLALAIITIVSIVLIIGILLIQNSFQRGFLNYLNSLESQRVERLAKRLKKDYQETGDWSFLPLQRGWRRYIDDALRPPRREDKNRQSQQRKPDHWQDRHRPPRHHNAPSPPCSHEDNQRRPRHHRPPPRPKTMFHDLASKEDIGQTERSDTKVYISLYSHDKKLILGIEQDRNTVIQYPIYLDKQRLAYLYIKPFTKLTSQLDQDFVKQQQGSFVKIMLFAFVITLLGAWLLALYFRKRIAPLTQIATQLSSGNYQYRAKLKQKDELGQLAIDLNHLGKTLQQNQTSRQQWIADISHELRTPLSILRGELEAIEDGIRPMNKTSIQSLVAEVKRLGKLVEDLYQLSLSDLGALNYVKEPLDLYELIQNVAAFFTQRFNEHNIDISFHIDNQAAMIFGDEKRLFQLFSNLFENTVRYTDAGGQLKIYCFCENNQIRVKLEDSKPAVSDEQLTRLFDRLYRVEASRNRASGGAGLGLSIVKAVADAHNATIISSHSSLGGLAVTLEIEQYSSK